MLGLTLSDLRFRSRQFLIAVVGAGLVFAMSMLLSGLAAGFGVEVHQTVQSIGADAWVMAQGSSGRVAALAPIPQSSVAAVARAPGVRRAEAVVVMPREATVDGTVSNIVLIGATSGALGSSTVVSGHRVAARGEAVVDARLGAALGRSIQIYGHTFRVVGLVQGRTLLGGFPDVYVTLPDAQAVAFGGLPLVSAVVTRGVPSSLPAGLDSMSNAAVEQATLAGMKTGVSSINNSRIFMWVIAAVIVAALVYVTALQRTRDFAVLKALGCSSARLFGGLALQAVIVAVAAAAVGMALSNFMTGVFAQPVDVPTSAYIVLPVSALLVRILASLIALRRAVSVDPAAAFAGG